MSSRVGEPGLRSFAPVRHRFIGTAPARHELVELSLFAPHNDQVMLLGEWNHFIPQKMQKGADGCWRLGLMLPDGVYRYRFRVRSKSYFALDREVEVPDPHALEITRGAPGHALLRIVNGARQSVAFDWQNDGAALLPNDQLVLYEAHVGDFAGGESRNGTFNDLRARLDYLADLGVNAIQLMPVTEFGGRGWGYGPRSLFALESTYGTPADLCRLVDACHGRGMRVLLDGVFNHADPDAYLAQIAYEYWFYRENPDGPEMDWGPKFNFEHYDPTLDLFPARKHVLDAIRFWVETFHIDGLRFDATRALQNFDLMREMTDTAVAAAGGREFICIAEHVPEDPEIAGRELGRPMDAAWHDRLARVLQAVASQTEQAGNRPDDVSDLLQRLNPRTNGYGEARRTVNFIGCHDYKRPMTLITAEGGFSREAAFRRMRLATGLLLTAPGLPMLWMGCEFGMPGDRMLGSTPMDWDLLSQPEHAELRDLHRLLIGLRQRHAALSCGAFEPVLCDSERQLVAFRRWTADTSLALVVAHLRDDATVEASLENTGLLDGPWTDAISGAIHHVADGKVMLSLGPSGFVVLVREPGAACAEHPAAASAGAGLPPDAEHS